MVKQLFLFFTFVLFIITTVQSYPLSPIPIRAVAGEKEGLSASVIEGIVIGIMVLVAIPILWFAYKMLSRHWNIQHSGPVYVQPPPTYATPNQTRNSIPLSNRITPVQRAHTKVNAPMFHA